jgi:hypothetical protein
MRALFVGVVVSCLVTAPALACGSTDSSQSPFLHVPPLTESLDKLLSDADADLSSADRSAIVDLRARIADLASMGKEHTARKVQARTMRALGFEKRVYFCGPGSVTWVRVELFDDSEDSI